MLDNTVGYCDNDYDISEKLSDFFNHKIASVIGSDAFDYWFCNAKYQVDDTTNTLTIIVQNEKYKDHIIANYIDKIYTICSETWSDRHVNVSILQEKIKRQHTESGFVRHQREGDGSVAHVGLGLGNYTFETFIEDESNVIALNATRGISGLCSGHALPHGTLLYIHSSVGLGKTHLCQAIMNQYRSIDGKIIYLSAEEFTLRYISSVKNNSIFEFKQDVISHDILVLDDLHFLFRKKSTIEELTNIISCMMDQGKYVVLTTTINPASLVVNERLQSRIHSGAIIEISKPSVKLKKEIALKCGIARGINFSDEILDIIIDNVQGGIREVHGAVNRIAMARAAHNFEINHRTVSTIMLNLAGNVLKCTAISIDNIKSAVSTYYNIPIDTLTSKIRSKSVVHARNIVMYLARNMMQMSYANIATHLGMKNHATIMYGIKKVMQDGSMNEITLIENRIRTYS